MPQLIRPSPRPRSGVTLIEQLGVLALAAILLAITVVSGARLLDAMAVSAASQELVDLVAGARDAAFATQRRTAVRFDAPEGRVLVHAESDTIARTVLTAGIRLEATRDSMAYAPSGLGYGAANLRLIVSRGRSADTITISRLGRVSRQ
jgi:Tfp pilus assembly protein FimT